MNVLKKIHPIWYVALIVLVVLAFGVVNFTKAQSAGIFCNVLNWTCQLDTDSFKEVAPTPDGEDALGALSSPDSPFKYTGVGGLREIWVGGNLAASSTACSISPDFGTTTVTKVSFQTVGTSSATTLVVAKATNDTNATTTALFSQAIAAGVKATIYAATSTVTTGGQIADDLIDNVWTLAPNDVLNFDVQGLVEGDQDTKGLGIVGDGGWRQGTCGAQFLVH